MNDFFIYIKLEHYVAEWLIDALGRPVRFPRGSFENAIIHRYLRPTPPGTLPILPKEDYVPIVIPDSRYKPPHLYNYFGVRGQKVLKEAIDILFRLDMWAGLSPLLVSPGELNQGIYEWCDRHGISIDSREAVRQKFYRIRRSYQTMGIILGKKYKKKV